MNLKNKKVLVTGAGGFIGSHLSELLSKKKCKVTCLVQYNAWDFWGELEHLKNNEIEDISVIKGDIQDANFMNSLTKDKDVVFHLAALIAIPYSYVSPTMYTRVNVEGTLNVLNACKTNGVAKVIHTSTSEVYGTAKYVPIDEKHPLQGQSPYSASKIGADKLAESYYDSFNLPVAIVRPFNTFGPRQSARAVIPTIISQALTQNKIILGSLTPRRDFTYVKDTANLFIKAAESDKSVGEVINGGTNKDYSIKEVAEMICNLIGKKIPILSEKKRVRPKKSEVEVLKANNLLAKKILGWEPEYRFEDGLKETIEWIKKNLSRYNIKRYTI